MKSHELVACSASDQTHANVTTSLVKFRDRFFHDVAYMELHPTKNEPNTLYQTDIWIFSNLLPERPDLAWLWWCTESGESTTPASVCAGSFSLARLSPGSAQPPLLTPLTSEQSGHVTTPHSDTPPSDLRC